LLIHADSGMVEQIVMNLAVNARDAMPRGGALHISTLATEMDSRTTKQNIEAQPGTYVCLQVSDSGTGIPPDVLPRIFEPFFTTKEIGKGTGLGLATIYGIVKQHKGWIDVFSRVGEGTTFKVFLPGLQASSSCSGAGVKQAADAVAGGRELVLVVEDEDELRGLVREVLQRYGYRVIEAGSGPEALRVWEENRKEIQLLLTDMVMPGNMSGRELAETLRARQPRLKVIFTSGYSVDVVDKDFGLQPGLFFLQKPYPPPALARMVRECLDGVDA
jgi:CheY-like chemotaxis protein